MLIKQSQGDAPAPVNAYRMQKMCRPSLRAQAVMGFVFSVWFYSTALSFEAQLYWLYLNSNMRSLELFHQAHSLQNLFKVLAPLKTTIERSRAARWVMATPVDDAGD